MNKLNEPLGFHLEELITEYGLVEIFHNLILIMEKEPKYQPLINSLESIRDSIGDINSSENLGAIAPEQVDRPNNENP